MLNVNDAWSLWQPTAGDPWTRKWAAHLYRRAGFGANREELLAAETRGHEATIDLLLKGEPKSAGILATLQDVGKVAAAKEDGGDKIRDWWVYCMLHGGHPLREKLTLFWHNHFATSIAKVRGTGLMFSQNTLLREHALGKFEPFLQAMSRDPAMLLWLDSNSNVKGKPNENYAREVMELFSLGVGNYTETDIREAARAFTGWHTTSGAFKFNSALHDSGEKSFFKQTGNWDGGDIVRMILKQPAAAKFLVGKLYTHFVSEAAPPAGLLDSLCDSLRKNDYDVAALMRTMLSSKWFFSEHAFRKRIKSPAEFVLGTARAVYREFPEDHVDYRPLPHGVLVARISAMAQTLFAPPNVKGWPGGKAWLNTATMLERNNFIAAISMGSLWYPNEANVDWSAPAALDPGRIVEEAKASNAEEIVDAVLDVYLAGGVRPETRRKLLEFADGIKRGSKEWPLRSRELVHAVLTLPEYQLA